MAVRTAGGVEAEDESTAEVATPPVLATPDGALARDELVSPSAAEGDAEIEDE